LLVEKDSLTGKERWGKSLEAPEEEDGIYVVPCGLMVQRRKKNKTSRFRGRLKSG